MRKYKVLIADDNKLIRDGLCAMVNWEEYGYQLAGTAKNGKEALDFLEHEPCDLLITDIRMPEISGLELLKCIQDKGLEIEVIIISAYSEFSYAQTAAQYGVESYLLKPVSRDELIESLMIISTNLQQRERNTRHEIERVLLKFLISPVYATIDTKELKDTGITLDSNFYCLTLLHLDSFDEKTAQLFGNDESGDTAQDVVNSFLSKYSKSFSIMIAADQMLILFLLEENNRNQVKALVSELAEYMEMYSDAQILAIIGETVPDFRKLSGTWLKMQIAASNEAFWNHRGVLIMDAVQDDSQRSAQSFDISALINAVKSVNTESAISESEKLVHRMQSELPSIDVVRATVSEIMFRLTDIVSEFGGDPAEALQSQGYHDNLYMTLNNINDISTQLTQTIRVLCEYLNGIVKSNGQIRISDIVNYINRNYSEPITVKKISEMFYISPVYLGRLFSTKMGVSLNSYVNSVRMKNAKSLLTDTDLKVYVICTRVGYKSIKYFYKVFKDEVGLTPHEYRLIHGS